MGSLFGDDCSERNLKSECAGFILISSYSVDGSEPEIVLYKIELN